MKQKLTARDIQTIVKLALWVLVIAYLCFSSGERINEFKLNSIIPLWLKPYMDKIVHFCMFFGLAFLIKSLYWQKTVGLKPYYILLVAGVGYAALTEVIQYYYIYTRSGDVFDFFCDLTGMTISVFLFPYWPRFVRWLLG
ncbi:MAG: VanZ family protein [Salinivirgaceae bacterium]|nr:VanZ family protein [Salinivirgaceae bacterium]